MSIAHAPIISAHGAQIPAIGLGTGGAMDESCGNIVAAALHAGYRHIDTARKYGTEQGVGEGIRASGIPRGQIFLTTKVSHEDLYAADFERSTVDSLRALGVDYVDLLMVHWPMPDMPLAETIGALAEMKRRGLARHIGVANFNIALMEKAAALCAEPLAALQAEYHIGLDQTKVLEFCRARGMAFVSYCPLGRGRLLDNPAVMEIARAKGKTVAQIALRWLVQQPNVAAIPGTSNPKRALENLDVFGFSLTDEEMVRLHALARPDGRIVSPRGRAPAWD
jgi:diketogulonate reductase-like aldo/keto reductase